VSRKAWIALFSGVVVVVLVVAGYFTIPALSHSHDKTKPPAVAEVPMKNQVPSQDGKVILGLPDGMLPADNPVTFTAKPKDKLVVKAQMKGVSPLGDPVDIIPTAKKLPPNKVWVSFKYDPATLPSGVTPTNLGLAVRDPNLGWTPILTAKADETTHTISALAPHFSEYVATFLDKTKSAVQVGANLVHTVIDGAISIAQWYVNLYKELIVTTVKGLIGTGPSIEGKCTPKSSDLQVKVDSFMSRLTGCMVAGSGDDDTLRLANGYGFPILSDPLPEGYKIRFEDAMTNGDDVPAMLRSWFWALFRRGIVPPTELGSVSIIPQLPAKQTATYRLDAYAVRFDILLTFISVIFPETAEVKTEVKQGLKQFLATGKKVAKDNKGLIADTLDVMQCAVTANHETPPAMFTADSYKWAASMVEGCLSAMLGQLGLKESMADLLSVVKIVPEIIESQLAQAISKYSFNLIKTKSYAVTVSKANPFTGVWKEGSSTLTFSSDGKTATRYWGLCNQPGCFHGKAKLAVAIHGRTAMMTYLKVEYLQDDGSPMPGDVGEGDSWEGDAEEVSLAAPGLLNRTYHFTEDVGTRFSYVHFLCQVGSPNAKNKKCQIGTAVK